MLLQLGLPAILFCCALSNAPASKSMDLSGTWGFRLDPKDEGVTAAWYGAVLEDRVTLPGSTDTNGKGTPNVKPRDYSWLSRVVEYVGPAWYSKSVEIPNSWASKRIELVLERCHWETQVWVDGKPMGMKDSLCVAQVHDLTQALSPGKHTIAIRVDNRHKFNLGQDAHSVSEQTQTNWNGVVGKIELRASDYVRVVSAQVTPSLAGKLAKVRVKIENSLGHPIRGKLALFAREPNDHAISVVQPLELSATATEIEVSLPMGKNFKPWDEFTPTVYTLEARFKSDDGKQNESFFTDFGMREIAVDKDKRLTLNGRQIFVRGTLECCIFPKTGFPPTDVEGWTKVLTVAKSYGLNHLRFHSWCPPEAAFVAADKLGFTLHVEAPQWAFNVGQDGPRDQFIRDETKRILDTYGNHPSFAFFCLGNELAGDPKFLQEVVKWCKAYDPRHLYTPSTAWSFGEEDQYRVAMVRGLNGEGTERDFREEDAKQPVPVISHEVGQWTIFPNMAEIPKYTGVTRARNFELIRDDLTAKGLIDQAETFTKASGALSALLYKEEIEVLLRTPGHGGFQLLDLHDFPGQGTATVGILDAFWESKGAIEPERWRRFCSSTVPLARLSKRTFVDGETLSATIELAHFGPKALKKASFEWRIKDSAGTVLRRGDLAVRDVPTGELAPLGTITTRLEGLPTPSHMVFEVAQKNGPAANDWDIWLYQKESSAQASDVVLSSDWAAAKKALGDGKKVLLIPSKSQIKNARKGVFTTVFWSPVWFNTGKGTMGLLCDSKHPALALFPTDRFANWQWKDLCENSAPMPYDAAPGLKPIVQVIDNFTTNERLTTLFEAKVGSGKLIVCTMNLSKGLDQRPAARQLLASLTSYMSSDSFAPQFDLPEGLLDTAFKQPRANSVMALGAKVVHADSQDPKNPASNALDGDPETFWHTEWGDREPGLPHEIIIDLGKDIGLDGIVYTPRQDMSNGRIAKYEVYVSDTLASWGKPIVSGSFVDSSDDQEAKFGTTVLGRYVRFVALSEVGGRKFASIAELDILLPPKK